MAGSSYIVDSPPVSKGWRVVVRQLRKAGCTFEVHKVGPHMVLAPDGTATGLCIPRRGKGSADMSPGDKVTLRALEARGWYNPGGKPTTKEAHDAGKQAVVQGGAHSEHAGGAGERQPPAHTQPRRQHHDRQGPGPRRVLAAAVPGREQVVAGGGGGVVVRLPVRARTAHQHRLDNVRHRVLRVLHELGGNKADTRTEFCKDALAEAVRHGLRVPNPGKGPDRDKRTVGSMHQSLRNLLAGKGQTDWMLDVWELSCALLEMPLGQAGAPAALADEPIVARHKLAPPVVPATVAPPVPQPAQPAEATTARGYSRTGTRGVGVQPFADDGGGANGGATGATVGQHNDEDGRLVQAQPVPTPEAARLAAAVEVAAAALDGELASTGGLVVAQRKQYLQALQEAALAGDDRAATRLERLLGL